MITAADLLVSANLKARTCEEIVQQKKTLHVAAFRDLVDECARGLAKIAASEKAVARLAADRNHRGRTVGEVIEKVVSRVREVLSRHEAKPAAEYLEEATYKALVQASRRAVPWHLCPFHRSHYICEERIVKCFIFKCFTLLIFFRFNFSA